MKKTISAIIISAVFIASQYFVVASALPSPLSVTERMNAKSQDLDALSPLEIATLMNNEDGLVAAAITPCLPNIATAIATIAKSFQQGGRLIYLGAGSSGRLGVLDASECVPTFAAPPTQVVGIIAGGDQALRNALEGVEDNEALAEQDLTKLDVTSKDVVCGISASGSAAYVARALAYARERGCYTIAVGCNPGAVVGKNVNCFIAANVGPEILTGSTRLKAGTATKMILNMLTTGAFILCGKVYKNLMIDVKPLNKKLFKRCYRIISTVCDVDETQAAELFEKAGQDIKGAILIHMFGVDCQQAQECLKAHKGLLRDAVKAMGCVKPV